MPQADIAFEQRLLTRWHDSRPNYFDFGIRLKGLPDPIAQQSEYLLVRLAKKAPHDVQTNAMIDRDNPLGWIVLRSITCIGQSYPEAFSSMRRPKSPTVIFLDGIGKMKAFCC